ncbi:MAG TPA: hypothetical protein VHT30_06670 [Acidimicrobiales bacterium]|jgi:hypothetical protein|nr:hypothetical protein [Acidimicrobiales bacterium]
MRWGRGAGDDWIVVGAAVPGTEGAIDAIESGAARGLGADDPYFDPATFSAWSATVFDRAMTAWRTGNPEPLHPVMQDQVWSHYAQWLLFVRAVPIVRSIMGNARGSPTFVGAASAGGQHSAVVEYAVTAGTTVLTPAGGDGTWRERWLFQRPASMRTNASGAVAVCPICGAPAQPEDTGQCPYCHADITTRTAGWLVTRTATTMHGAKQAQQVVGPSFTASTVAAPLQPPRGAPLQPPRAPSG